MYVEKKAAIFASIIFLLIPSIFYFGNHAFMDPGVVYFSLLSVYFFLQWVDSNKKDNLVFYFISLFIGFLYKDTIIFIFISNILFLFFRLLVEFYKKLSLKKSAEIIKLFRIMFSQYSFFVFNSFLFLLFAFVWLVMRNYFLSFSLSSGYSFSIQNLLIFDKLLLYAKLSPLVLSFPLFILSFLGLLFIIFKKKSAKEYYLLFWIITLYLVYTAYNWSAANPRFYLQFLPALLICAVIFQESLFNFISIKNIYRYSIYIILISFLFFSSLFLTYYNIDDRFWDYDSLYKSIKQNTAENDKILFLTHDVYYYFFKYNIKNPIITENQFRQTNIYSNITSISEFNNYLQKNDIDYVVFANQGELYTSARMYYPDPGKDKFLDEDRLLIQALNKEIEQGNMKPIEFVSGKNILYLAKSQNISS